MVSNTSLDFFSTCCASQSRSSRSCSSELCSLSSVSCNFLFSSSDRAFSSDIVLFAFSSWIIFEFSSKFSLCRTDSFHLSSCSIYSNSRLLSFNKHDKSSSILSLWIDFIFLISSAKPSFSMSCFVTWFSGCSKPEISMFLRASSRCSFLSDFLCWDSNSKHYTKSKKDY